MPRKGNTNALKHGLYAAHFSDETSQTALKKMPFDDLRQEIAALRIVGEKIMAKIEGQPDTDDLSKLTNSFVAAITAINTSMRTQALLQGTYNPLDDAINQALGKFDPFDEVPTGDEAEETPE